MGEITKMSKLKRCPFCGGAPKTEVEMMMYGGGESQADFSIRCNECGIAKTVRLKIKGSCEFNDIFNTMEKVEEIWNRRANNDIR